MMPPDHGGLSYRGLYLNLDRSEQRRRRLEAELERYALAGRYRRFAALDGHRQSIPNSRLTPGENGCYLSHVAALESFAGGQALHILEDDAVLSRHVQPVLEAAIAANLFERFDIVFLDLLLPPHLGMLKALLGLYAKVKARSSAALAFGDLAVIDLARQPFSCLTSYVVGARSAKRVLSLWRRDLAAGPTRPADLFIRDCVLEGQLRAACLFPFLTSIRLDDIAGETNARSDDAHASVAVLAALRHSFFIDADLDEAQALLRPAAAREPQDAHRALVLEALGFILSDGFREF